ncbi:hypothetical protein DFH06DRAFT_1130943 [Mycena polygramma]|nr:hypothetical protein DFH06DRAFT_1130943 [Mycena polygramma]
MALAQISVLKVLEKHEGKSYNFWPALGGHVEELRYDPNLGHQPRVAAGARHGRGNTTSILCTAAAVRGNVASMGVNGAAPHLHEGLAMPQFGRNMEELVERVKPIKPFVQLSFEIAIAPLSLGGGWNARLSHLTLNSTGPQFWEPSMIALASIRKTRSRSDQYTIQTNPSLALLSDKSIRTVRALSRDLLQSSNSDLSLPFAESLFSVTKTKDLSVKEQILAI